MTLVPAEAIYLNTGGLLGLLLIIVIVLIILRAFHII
jgi:hypothetical protein